MEPHGNIHHHHHHHQLQEYQLVASSPSLSSLSCYGIGIGSAAHSDSTPGYTFLNMHGFNPYNTQQLEKTLVSSHYNTIPSSDPNSGAYNWENSSAGIFLSSQFKQDLQFSRAKEEQLINGSSFMNKMELFPGNLNSPALYARAGAVFRAFPGVDVSYLNHVLEQPNSFDESIDSNASNLFGSSRMFSADLNAYGDSEDRFELLRDSLFRFGNVDHMQQTHLPPLHSSDKRISASSDGSAESRRISGKMEAKRAQTAAKKSRLGGRVSSPPFKVRKEKLGDRIAALQQMVAPFGKTDTASVLMEAIGYIKFLQNQVETLSVPYMKAASRNKTSRSVGNEKEHEEARRDLKSRGLCLVPVPCLSYIADGAGGGAVWPLPSPPHFGGAA